MALPLSYNWKNLFVRKVSTAFTVGGVGVVVFVFTALMAFVSGLERTLTITGDDRNVIVLKQGATAESNSAVNNEEYQNLLDAKNRGAIQAEYLTIAATGERGDRSGNWANVPVRGVDADSIKVHDKVRIVEGNKDGADWETFMKASPGKFCVIVGKAAAQRYSKSNKPGDVDKGLTVGDSIKLGFGGKNDFEIVGIFEAGGGVFESEIWTYGPHLKNKSVYDRSFYSSVTVKAQSPEDVDDLIKYAEGPKVQLTAMGEKAYFAQQTETTKPFLVLSYGLLVFMGIAAGFAVANNMYAMVAGRMREIAMLRAIGFSRGAVITSFIIESLILATLGGMAGCGLALVILPLIGQQDMIGGSNSFTSIVFTFDVSPKILTISMTLAVVLGLLGALFPALKAGRTSVVTALRQA